MKKLRKFYRNNRIYCILMIVSLFCFIVIGTSVVTYFVNMNNQSTWGPRTEGVDEHSIDKDVKSVKDYLKNNKTVKSSTVETKNKEVRIVLNVPDDIKLEDIQNIANSIVDLFSEENKKFYDIQFYFVRPSYSAYFGSKNSGSVLISWIANFESGEQTTEKTTTKKSK